MKLILLTAFADTIFTPSLRKQLDAAGEVLTFSLAKPLNELTTLFSSSDQKILAIDPRFCNWKVPNEIVDACNNVQAICLQTTSFSWIDVGHTAKLGIVVTNVRGFSTTAVAEWATMMTLLLARRVPLLLKGALKGEAARPTGTELKGKTAGVIGMGRIGTAVADKLTGLEMAVQYWSKNSSNAKYTRVSIEDLMSTSDVVLPTVAANEETKNLITDDMIRGMKSTAIFVSVVHPVYNHDLLLELAEKGLIYGYGFETAHHDFARYEGNVWAGPELAWFTDGSQSANASQWTDSIVKAVRGEYPTRVN